MGNQVELREATSTVTQQGKGIYRVKLIAADIQGSTGYYPAAVLERDGPTVFPQGTHIFLDHPTESEDWERPERSVKDLAAYLLDSATFEANAPEGAGLYSRMQVLPQHREFVEQAKDVVGMSIRALGIREYNQEMDRDEVTALVRGESVDIVTRAGAGGRILEMTESARPAGQGTPPQLFAELKESDKAGLQKLFDAFTEATSTITEFKKELDELKEKAATAKKEKEEANTLSFGDVVAKLDAANLPAVSRKHLANAYAPGMDLDSAIADEQARVEAIKSELGGAENKSGETGEDGGSDSTGVQESARNGGGVGQIQVAESSDVYSRANNLLDGLFG